MTVLDTRGIHGPAVAQVNIADVASKMLTMEQVRERLSLTEPMTAVNLRCGEANTSFNLGKTWNFDVDKLRDDELVDATMTIGGKEYALSKQALYETTSIIGLNTAYVTKSPWKLVQDPLNFYYGAGITDKDYKAYVKDDTVLAIGKATIDPFSNLRFLDESLAAIEAKYGTGTIYADYKFEHSLRRTALRLVVPETVRVIENTGTDNDTWSIGIQFLNSLIGLEKTSVEGYLFRYWCSNGAIDLSASSSSTSWDRRGGQTEEVYEWARTAVDSVFENLEHTLDKVQESVYVNVDGEIVDVAKEIFKSYKISPAAREIVMENLVESDELTMYAVMQAITAAANDPDLDPRHVEALLIAGGAIPQLAHTRCNSCHRFTASMN